MPSIKHKNSSVPGKEPLPGDLERAELAINLADKKIYSKDDTDTIVELGGGGAGKMADLTDLNDTPIGNGSIATFTLTQGTVEPGNYKDIILTGGTGSLATISVEVSSTDVVTIVFTNRGKDYTVADILDIPDGSLGATSTGNILTVDAIRPIYQEAPDLSSTSMVVRDPAVASGQPDAYRVVDLGLKIERLIQKIIDRNSGGPGTPGTMTFGLLLNTEAVTPGATNVNLQFNIAFAAKIFWNDSNTLQDMPTSTTFAHNYAAPGVYSITITVADSADVWITPNQRQIIKFYQCSDNFKLYGSMASSFEDNVNLEQFIAPSLTSVTNMDYAFRACGKLKTFRIEDQDMSSIKTMIAAFYNSGAVNFTGYDLSGLEGSNPSMFQYSGVSVFGTIAEPITMPVTPPTAALWLVNWFAQSKIRMFNISNGSGIGNLSEAFMGAKDLIEFNIMDLSLVNCTTIAAAFREAGANGYGLTIPGGFNFRGLTGSQTDAFGMSKFLSIGAPGNPVLMPTAQDYDLDYFATPISGPDQGAKSLTAVYFDTLERCTSLAQAFRGNIALSTFSVANGNMSKVTSLTLAFYSAGTASSGFSIQGGMNWRGLTGTQSGAFARSKVLAIGTRALPVLMPTAQDYDLDYFAAAVNDPNQGAFSLASVCFDSLERCTSLINAFRSNILLEEFYVANGDMSKVASLGAAFYLTGSSGPGFSIQGGMNWRGLTGTQSNAFARSKVLAIGTSSSPVLMPTAQAYDLNYFATAENDPAVGAKNLASVYFDTLESATDCYCAFWNNTALKDFRVTNVAVGFRDATRLDNAFNTCALTEESVDHILLLCVNGGRSNVTLTLSGGTSAPPSAAGLADKAILVGRGWTVTHN